MDNKYDIDILKGQLPKPNEIEVCQIMRPDHRYTGGERRRMFAPVGEEVAQIFKQHGFRATITLAEGDDVTISVIKDGGPSAQAYTLGATNGPRNGPDKEPVAVLAHLIKVAAKNQEKMKGA